MGAHVVVNSKTENLKERGEHGQNHTGWCNTYRAASSLCIPYME